MKLDTSELKLLQQRFWQSLKEYVNKLDSKSTINYGRTPRPQHWYDISFGTSKANISLTFNSKNNQIGCELYIKDDEVIYKTIEKDKELIEKTLGNEIQFMDLPDNNAFRILKTLPCKPIDENQWDIYFQWLNNQAEQFQKTFKKYF